MIDRNTEKPATLYGIKTCDSCRKAQQWLKQHHIAYDFIDFKQQAPSAPLIHQWLSQVSVQQLLNKRSTTWKQLSDVDQGRAETDPQALLGDFPLLIKRPVLAFNNHTVVGFSADHYSEIFVEE